MKLKFITCSSSGYNRNAGLMLFKLLNKILNVIDADKSFIIGNNRNVTKFLNIQFISDHATFDFENLFTSISHSNIIEVFKDICDKYLTTLEINKEDWIDLNGFCIFENYLFNDIGFFKQIRGIPIGSCFSSAFANIFLHFYESCYLCKYDISAYHYIVDIIVLNCKNVYNVCRDIYISELHLIKTDTDNLVTFLDIAINRSEGSLKIGLCDKRRDFNFRLISLSQMIPT